MKDMRDFCPVKGTKGQYLHDFNGRVFMRSGQELVKNSDGKFRLIVGFQPVELSFDELCPYKEVAVKVEEKKEEPKKNKSKDKK